MKKPKLLKTSLKAQNLLAEKKPVKSTELFVKFKSYIDDRRDSLIRASSYSNKPDFGPDAESKVFKRETESNKLNQKQYLFNAKIEDRNEFTLEILKKKDYEGAKRGINTECDQPNPE